jgi:hypothetical protein
MRRIGGPGLIRAIGKTSVIAGTETMTAHILGMDPRGGSGAYETGTEKPTAEPVGQPVSRPNIVDQLSDLANLRASGALTETEFVAAKAHLLD